MSGEIVLTEPQIEAIAHALADPPGGLTHNDITHLLKSYRMDAQNLDQAKWRRVYNGFVSSLNRTQNTTALFHFIRSAADPARFSNTAWDYESYPQGINTVLALVGASIDKAGKLSRTTKASSLREAEKRARDLREDLVSRGVHPDVLAFCRSELLVDDYFHAVLEATKSVADKLRQRTGLTDDGAVLVNHIFGGAQPILVINRFQSKSEKDEQKGFCNLLIGVFGMFRNPTAHEARVNWHMSKEDAEDLMSLVSLAHRRIDKAVMPSRV